jgi:DNA-binding NarL/FixJ family response regulator
MTGDGDVRVLIVDDQRPFRMAAAAVVQRTPGFCVAGQCASGEQAVLDVADLRPHLVLMDVQMPGMGGIAAAQQIRRLAPGVAVVLCSTYRRQDLHLADSDAYLDKQSLEPAALHRIWLDATSTPA